MAENLMVRLLAVSILCFLFSSCEEENKGDLIEPVPVVQTLPVNWTSATAAAGGGIIDGQANVTKRGLVWSTSPNPKITDSKSEAGSGNGEFTSTLTGISNSNTYYVRAYAETNSTVVYGNEVFLERQINEHTCGATNVHKPSKTYGSMSDQEGNVYKTIVIGTQEWMAENLNTSTYSNGDPIYNVIDNNQWGDFTEGAWCYYNNNEAQYKCPYGKLYNWYAVADPRNICPTGWHVPTDGEWTILRNFLGGESIAGGKMKSTGFQYWINPNQDATNESGFSGISGGARAPGGFDGTLGYNGNYWSSTEISTNFAWVQILSSSVGEFIRFSDALKFYGLSVRCIKD